MGLLRREQVKCTRLTCWTNEKPRHDSRDSQCYEREQSPHFSIDLLQQALLRESRQFVDNVCASTWSCAQYLSSPCRQGESSLLPSVHLRVVSSQLRARYIHVL